MPPRFGGAPQCPRCQKAVYMAEQVIGPGGAWHRNCLTCKECNKRLDSTLLTEREGEAYCKVCYTRKWGPKGYGFAGGAAFLSTESKMPSEIVKQAIPDSVSSPTMPVIQPYSTPPIVPPKPTSASTISPSSSAQASPKLPPRPRAASLEQTSINTPPEDIDSPTMSSFWSKPATKPAYTKTQTSYVPRKLNFTVQNDTCTKCGKAVYAAELALGAGNKYHKLCLKCCQCGKLLSSTNMVDRDFDLYCRGCYAKSFGPKGYGYGNLLTSEGATR